MVLHNLWYPSLGGFSSPFVQLAAEAASGTVPIQHQTTVGNVLVAFAGINTSNNPNQFLSSVTDSQGNTWHIDVNQQNLTSKGIQMAVVRAKLTTALGTSDHITITPNNAVVEAVMVAEFAGGPFPGSPLDQGTFYNSQTGVITMTSGSLISLGELAVAGMYFGGTPQALTWNPPTGYTEIPMGVTNNVMDLAFQIQPSNTPISINYSVATSATNAGALVTYVQ